MFFNHILLWLLWIQFRFPVPGYVVRWGVAIHLPFMLSPGVYRYLLTLIWWVGTLKHSIKEPLLVYIKVTWPTYHQTKHLPWTIHQFSSEPTIVNADNLVMTISNHIFMSSIAFPSLFWSEVDSTSTSLFECCNMSNSWCQNLYIQVTFYFYWIISIFRCS